MAKFVVAICTVKRPQMLAAALKSLINLDAPKGSEVSVLIVENDLMPSSESVISEMRMLSPFQLHYCLESEIGIPFARNRALSEAIAIGADWIAMIDDDELASRDWLTTLYNGCLRFDADVATGPIDQISEGTAPHWWKPVADSRNVTGEFRQDAYTNNVLFDVRIVKQNNLKFDRRFIHGAEDIDFFRRAAKQGVRIVSIAEARVVEIVPLSRLSLKRYLQRNYTVAASNSFLRAVHYGPARAAMDRLPGIVRRFFVGITLVVAGIGIWPFARTAGERVAVKGASGIAKALGSLSGLIGKSANYYENIDGN